MTQLTRRGRGASLVAIAAAAALVPAEGALAAGTLEWTQANVYETTAPPNTNRTWLGYVTNPAPFGAKGTVSAVAPATGGPVTPESPRSAQALHTFRFPLQEGKKDRVVYTGGSDTFTFRGAVRFVSPGPAPQNGHDFTITIENPRVTLTGRTGRLYATGTYAPGGQPGASAAYDGSQPIFDLDLSTATVTVGDDGMLRIRGIVPKLATVGVPFPPNYQVGAGPDRTPNTFGELALRVRGKERVARISRAPFGTKQRKVTVTRRGSRDVLAKGTVRGRTLRYTGASRLKGTVVLRAGKRIVSVRIVK
jgi:hypothetical protein